MTTAVKLYWSENGEIGCSKPGHRPFPGSDTWRSGRWRKMTAREFAAMERENGRAPECEACTSIRRVNGEEG